MKCILLFTFQVLLCIGISAQSIEDYQSYFSNQVSSKSYSKQDKTDENCPSAQPNRSMNGSCNNMEISEWGSANQPFYHMLTPMYGTNGSMTGQNRQSARKISNLVCHQDAGVDVLSERGLSAMVYTFFQFIDHNITATMEGHTEFEPITVPMNDPFFDPNGTGTQMIPFTRSMKMMDENGMPHQMNLLSSWIDGAGIYGTDEFRANWLRTFQDGKLKTSENNLLPCNTITGDCTDAIDTLAPFMVGNENNCGSFQKVFVAGDVRANEQPGLLALHTLFVREHNLICDELKTQGYSDDEIIYQKARRIVVGKLQAIVYNELLPALGVHLEAYSGYEKAMRPDIYSIFSTAAFRLGHTMVMDNLLLLNDDCQPMMAFTGCGPADGDCSCYTNNVQVNGSADIKDVFFHPSFISNIGIDPILKGLTVQTQQEIDVKVVSALRNFLFGVPGLGGLDLAALNIQRGRDHGLPDYNTVREYFFGNKAQSFSEITSDIDLQNALSTAYNGDINDIDLFIGLLSEDHLPNSSVGATLHAILKDQFTKLRNADRYFYKIDPMLTDTERQLIKNTRFSNLIERNTDLLDLAQNAFYARSCDVDKDIHFYGDNKLAYPNKFVEIPIQVDNFKNVYELDIDIQWDSTKLAFEQVSSFEITDGNVNYQPSSNSLNIHWSNYQNAGNSLANGQALLVLKFKAIGNTDENVVIDIISNFTASTQGTAPIFEVTAQTRAGNIHIADYPAHFNITGLVTTPLGYAVEDVEVNFIKNNYIHSFYYIQEGQSTFEKSIVVPHSDFEFWIKSVSTDCSFCRSLNVLDAILLNEYLLGNRQIQSAYTHLAADTDENQVIDNADLAELLDLMMRRKMLFTNQNYHLFSTEKQPTLSNPYDLITKRSYADIQEFLYAQNFMGVPKGKIAKMEEYQPNETIIDYNSSLITSQELKNDTIRIPIRANDFGTIKGLQWTIEWDANVLEYLDFYSERLTNLNSQHFDVKDIGNGQLAIVWFSENGQPLNLLNGEILLELEFMVKGETGDFSFINISNSLKEAILIDENLDIKQPIFDIYKVDVIQKVAGSDNIFQLVAFPNPTQGAFDLQFQLDKADELNLTIFDALGKTIYQLNKSYQTGLHQLAFDDLDLIAGVYFIRFEYDGEVVIKRLVKK